ncbi:putative glycolipid-binding domain-containing protein [Dongia deserti]|uniref:putative glycolipid-binding domain-containing protein n=1 Tax=Dongia deserti TaxID=2268030 RepID=UPI000E6491D9|nr:putative glycolipid-binding domain-containing protein [Dongia deserti]
MNDQSWRWIWLPDLGEGVEQFTFHSSPVGYDARGSVAATLEGAALNARYLVETDVAWRTRRVRVAIKGGRLLEIFSDGAGDWSRGDGEALPELDGCLDPDISMTPFTNTLAIRRLGLKIGESAEIEVAYILVPELGLRAAPQRYTRVADRLWRFEGLDIDFTADIAVDESGFVVDYPGLFKRSV